MCFLGICFYCLTYFSLFNFSVTLLFQLFGLRFCVGYTLQTEMFTYVVTIKV